MQLNPNAAQDTLEMALIIVTLLSSSMGIVYLIERWKKKHSR